MGSSSSSSTSWPKINTQIFTHYQNKGSEAQLINQFHRNAGMGLSSFKETS